MWEANVARNLETLPRASSPYPRKTSTLEDLEPDTDDNMVDITDFFERPPNEKRSPRPKHTDSAQGHCPTPQNSPTYMTMNVLAVTPVKPHRTDIWGILPDKRKVPLGWPACLRRQPPRVAFKNNNICIVDNEESSNYEEPRERHPKFQYKLKICENPVATNMPHGI